MKSNDVHLAIDLGTTNIKMAIYRFGNIEIIPNHEGKIHRPSVIGFDNQGNFIVGREAYQSITSDPSNVGLDVTQDFVAKRESTFCRSEHPLQSKDYATGLLEQLKADAERFINDEIEHVVITLPVSASNSYIEMVKGFALAAGFKWRIRSN